MRRDDLGAHQLVGTPGVDLGIDLEALAGIVVEVLGEERHRHAAEGLGQGRLVGRRNGRPLRPHGEARHGGEVEGAGHHRLQLTVAALGPQALGLLHHRQQGVVEAVDLGRGRVGGLGEGGGRRSGADQGGGEEGGLESHVLAAPGGWRGSSVGIARTRLNRR